MFHTKTAPVPPHASRLRRTDRQRAFTLTELMISAGLSVFVLAGILATFLMLGRSGYNASSYSTMDAEARRALEKLSEDARMATNIEWTSNAVITLTIAGNEITYGYDSSTTGDTARSFYRKEGKPSGTAKPLILVRDVSEFAFCRYRVVNGVDFTAANDIETKQIQITLRAVRARSTVVAATNAVLSARIVLRNKKVTT
jgi:type II secretory pathway pseudopilin PulG